MGKFRKFHETYFQSKNFKWRLTHQNSTIYENKNKPIKHKWMFCIISNSLYILMLQRTESQINLIWFETLAQNTPDDVRNIEYFNTILQVAPQKAFSFLVLFVFVRWQHNRKLVLLQTGSQRAWRCYSDTVYHLLSIRYRFNTRMCSSNFFSVELISETSQRWNI